ncbi:MULTISPECIES: TnsA-like heteromeric transposase endonuclease subunit [Streptomyces]|uniref:TnsA-like heteromeric transposase endonuclease subunit n=1 Tax=Streptomyces TaxID=1883 RepID=UPI001F267D0D|nr:MULTISPECIES: TnsA-like heteromeric transposase endonuclease subunit [unclassified Streptomyces]
MGTDRPDVAQARCDFSKPSYVAAPVHAGPAPAAQGSGATPAGCPSTPLSRGRFFDPVIPLSKKQELPPSAAGSLTRCSIRRVDPAVVQARFVDGAGQEHQIPWLHAAAESPLEECVPVQRFPVLKGRRVAPGWWWTATSGRHVHYGFGAMRTQVMLLDRDPQVTALACRPVELMWRGRGGKTVSHAPHLMARLADGSGVLIDCAGARGAGRRLIQRAIHVEAAAEAAGWHYRVVGAPTPAVEANVRWLAGYRHPRCAPSGLSSVSECFRMPRPLVEGVRLLGDPIAVWPAVFHALWRGVLSTALHRPLHERALTVSTYPGAGAQL